MKKQLLIFFIGAVLFASSLSGQVIIQGPTLVCEGDTATYSFTPLNPGANIWIMLSTTGTILSSTDSTAIVHWHEAPAGALAVTGANFGTLNVTIGEAPENLFITVDISMSCADLHGEHADRPPEEDSTECIQICADNWVEFTAHGNPTNQYTWFVSGGTLMSTSGNTAEVLWDTPGIGQITVTETSPAGCGEATQTRCVEILPPPEADFGILPNVSLTTVNVCIDQELQFVNNSNMVGTSPIVSAFWDFGDGNTSYDTDPVHEYSSPGTYYAVLILENSCHCRSQHTVEVIVSAAEPVEIVCPSVVCEGENAAYRVDDNVICTQFDWDVVGGSFTSASTAVDEVSINWNNPDSSGFGYIYVYDNYCMNNCPGNPTIIKVPIIAQDGDILGHDVVCANGDHLFHLPRWPGTTFNWSVDGDGSIYPSDQPNEIVLNAHESGEITLKCVYDNVLAGCGGNASITLDIVERGIISGPAEACLNGQTISYQLQSGLIGDWILHGSTGFPETATGNSFTPTTINQTGNYTLAVSGEDFCAPPPLRIRVTDSPSPPLSISGPDSICLNTPIVYSYMGDDDELINWEIEGGAFPGSETRSTGVKTTATFSGSGPFVLKTWKKSAGDPGCSSDTLFTNLYPLEIDVSINGSLVSCDNSFENYASSYPAGDVYEWSIIPEAQGSVVAGDGTGEVVVLWNSTNPAQNVDLAVRVRSCGIYHYDTISVFVTPTVELEIIAPDTVCRGELFNISLSGIPPLTSFSNIDWDFGDGNGDPNAAASTNHAYTNIIEENASYTIQVSVEDPNNCQLTAVAEHTIIVEPSPVAYISPSGGSDVCDSLTVNQMLFATVQSGLGATALYEWFRDGTPLLSGPSETSFQATQAGNYYCVVSGENGCTDTTNTVSFNFIDCSNSGGAPSACVFDNSPLITINDSISECGEISLSASFNGTFSSELWTELSGEAIQFNTSGNTAQYTFDKSGIFVFEYRVTTISGGDTCLHRDTVHVHLPYLAGLKYSVSCGGPGTYDVNLLDHSTHLPGYPIGDYSFFINGSPAQSGLETNMDTILAPGTYDLELVIGDGIHPNCTIQEVLELPNMPQADFEFDFDGACEGFPIQFINTSSPSGDLRFAWDFEDGAETTVENPSRVFAAGDEYNVELIVRNSLGCSQSISKLVTVNVNNLGGIIMSGSPLACEGDGIGLAHNPQGTDIPTQYIWQPDSFAITSNPSVSVQESGSYFVTLRDANGCVHHVESNANVEFVPAPNAAISGPERVCLGSSIRLYGDAGEGSLIYDWELNGNFIGGDPELHYTPTNSGVHVFELTVTNFNPLICQSSTTYEVFVSEEPEEPEVQYSLLSCDPYLLTLSATHPESGTFNWSNGWTGSSMNTHRGGEFSVLFTNEAGCSNEKSFYVPKSVQEYFWIFPTGCYEVCEELLSQSDILFPSPLVPFDSWAFLRNGTPALSGSGIPEILLSSNTDEGLYTYTLEKDNCSHTHGDLELEKTFCGCEIEASPISDMQYIDDALGCRNIIQIQIFNPYFTPEAVTLSSPLGVFIPSTVNAPSGFQVFTFEFIPNAAATPGGSAPISIRAELDFGGGQTQSCVNLGQIPLSDPLCDNNSWYKRWFMDESGAIEGDDSEAAANTLTIFPNPAVNTVEIAYTLKDWHRESRAQLEVFDLRGVRLLSRPLFQNEGSERIDIPWPAGLYLVSIHLDGRIREVKRLIVQ